MSIINETLDNLKQTKKPVSGALNPSSSVYREQLLKAEKPPVYQKSYLIPISFAIVVGLLFYISQLIFSSKARVEEKKIFSRTNTVSWFKSNLKKNTPPAANLEEKIAQKIKTAQNYDVQNLYYQAMVLVNEGKEQEALQTLKKLVIQYPEFLPAQSVYNNLVAK